MSKRTWKECAQDNGECKGRTSVISAVRCHLCGGSLIYEEDGQPVTIDNINTEEEESTVPKVTKIQKIKNYLGGIRMNTKINWKAIGFGILALVVLAAFFLFFKALSLLGIPGIVALVGLGFLFLASTLLSANQIKPNPKTCVAGKNCNVIGAVLIIAAVILFYLLPALGHVSIQNTEKSKGESFSLGVPADTKTVDPLVWNKPMQDGVMIDGNGNTVYTQSGKNGSILLKGIVPEGQTLVLDAYGVNGRSGGALIVKDGPYSLDVNSISYKDGCAQLVSTPTVQTFLDNNVAVKFARGDRLKDDSAWSYKHWALDEKNNLSIGTYTYHKLVLTAKTDTYPNK